jgi:hypothetical protein
MHRYPVKASEVILKSRSNDFRKYKRRLGLDADGSWLMVTEEKNFVDMPSLWRPSLPVHISYLSWIAVRLSRERVERPKATEGEIQ